jgi:hypothetical protein
MRGLNESSEVMYRGVNVYHTKCDMGELEDLKH